LEIKKEAAMNQQQDYKLPSLSEMEIKKLIRTVREVKGKKAERDHMIIDLFLKTGLRLCELSGLTVGDLQEALENGRLRIRKEIAKGGKEREIPLHKDLENHLKNFLTIKRHYREDLHDSTPLFVSKKGNALSRRSIQDLVEYWSKRSGLGKFSPHGLRHSFSVIFVQNYSGGPLKAISILQGYLGHSSPATTQIYLRPSTAERTAAIQCL
jgi:site-specific recombinase XerD